MSKVSSGPTSCNYFFLLLTHSESVLESRSHNSWESILIRLTRLLMNEGKFQVAEYLHVKIKGTLGYYAFRSLSSEMIAQANFRIETLLNNS
jgi:hypothetical protein